MAGVDWQMGDHVMVRGMPWTIREARPPGPTARCCG